MLDSQFSPYSFHVDGLCWLTLNTTTFALLILSHVATLVHLGVDVLSVQWGSTHTRQPDFTGGPFPGC